MIRISELQKLLDANLALHGDVEVVMRPSPANGTPFEELYLQVGSRSEYAEGDLEGIAGQEFLIVQCE